MSGQGMEWIDRVPLHQPFWLFFTLFLLLAFIAWIRLNYGNILVQTAHAASNFQVATRMFNDNSIVQRQLDNVLYICYLLSAAFVLYLLEERYGWRPYGASGFVLYLFNLALLLGLFFARMLLANLTGIVFNQRKLYQEYLYNMFIFNKLLGLVVLPLLVFVLYSRGIFLEIASWVLLASLSAVIVLRVLRAFVFSFKKNVSIFYMFLYLCALEIAPLVLLYRWLEGIL
jgi:hypothetical protein